MLNAFKGTYNSGVKRADRNDRLLMLRRAIEKTRDGHPTGYLFWADQAVEKKKAAGDSSKDTARRYACPDCVENLLGPVIDDAREPR